MEKSDSFCILPWIHISSKSDGRLRQCCRARDFIESDSGGEFNINREPFEKAWNSKHMMALRKNLLENKRPSSCGLCWEEEDRGMGSRRISENQLWSQRISFEEVKNKTQEDGFLSEDPLYWDLRLGNACNLKCIMCNPVNSSLWLRDEYFIDRYSHLKKPSREEDLAWGEKPELWEHLRKQLPNIQELYFSGGEPLLSQEHRKILELAIEKGYASNIHLRYDTNGTLLGDSIFRIWSAFKSVHINLSIDGIEQSLEYIRYPLKWSKLEKTFQKLEKSNLTNIVVNPQFSLSALNALSFLDFIEWKLDNCFEKIGTRAVTDDEVGESHLVTDPEFLSLQALPEKKKGFVRLRYKEFIEKMKKRSQGFSQSSSVENLARKLQDYLNYMDAEDNSERDFPTMIQYLKDLDLRRGTNYREAFSWIETN